MNAFLEIAALGPLRITLNGAPVDKLTSSKAEALLVYLACRGRPQPREAVAELLWPERSRDQALSNLRVALSRLRGALPSHVLTTRQHVGVNPNSRLRLDVSELEAGVAAYRARRDDPHHSLSLQDAERLAQALSLYRGEFLQGFHFAGGFGFDEWVLMERERLHLLVIDALQDLSALYLELEDYPAGIEQARRLIRLDPLHEGGRRLLMRLLASSGQRNAALRQYELCKQILADELGVAPEPATRALYDQIRAHAAPRWAASGENRARRGSPPPCPYRGLNAFGEADAEFFFGREAFSLRVAQTVQHQPVTTVVGPSGSGKSSVVFAGLLPHLRRAADSTWMFATFRPGDRPFYSLAAAFIDRLEPNASEAARVIETRKLSDALETGAISLRDVIHRLLQHRPSNARLLIIVDQFEELYALCPDPEERRRFLDVLLAPFIEPNGANPGQRPLQDRRCALLLTIRADFLEQALTHRTAANALQGGILILGPMTRAELQSAVAQPAARRGVHFESGLVERILHDVGTEAGRLPLLQFALTSLWERQENGMLTHAAYEAIGGVSQALTRHAEGVYASLSAEDQIIAHRALLQLVQPGEGAEDTRRRATREEISLLAAPAPQTNAAGSAWDVVRRLADARLVVTDRAPDGFETVEIVHEALIYDWPRLRAWLDEARAFRLWQERLRGLLRQWEGSEHDPRALLRGLLLNEAERWFADRESDLTAAEHRFISASLHAREQRRQEEDARRARERTLMQRSRNRLRALAAVLAAASLMALGLTTITLRQTRAARSNAAQSQSLALATAAQLALQNHDPNLALALALAANRIDNPSAQARLMLADAAYAPGAVRRLVAGGAPVRDAALLPGDRALSVSDDGVLRIWSLTSGQILKEFSVESPVRRVAVHPNGRLALLAASDGSVPLLDLESGAIVRRLRGHQAAVQAVAFAPSGDLALSGDADGVLILWNVATGEAQRRWVGHHTAVLSVAFSPDGRYALSGSADRTVGVWDLTSGDFRLRFTGHSDAVTDVDFTPDGRYALSASEDTSLLLWDPKSGEIVRRFPYETAGLLSLDVSPDGRSVLASSLDSGIVLWDVATGRKRIQFLGRGGRIFDVEFGPDDRFALSTGEDGALEFWRLRNGAETRVLRYESGASSVAISHDGSRAATGLANGDIVVWDAKTGQELFRLKGHSDRVFGGVRFGPDDKTLVSASGEIFDVSLDNTVRVWDLTRGEENGRLEGHSGNIWDVDLSADGRYALTASSDGTARLWDVRAGQEAARYEPSSLPDSVAFGPQGRIALVGTGRERPGGDEKADYSIRLWNLETGQEEGRLLGHRGNVMDIAIAPDGRRALSAGLDGAVLLWDLNERQVIRRLAGHRAGVMAVAFSPDGRLAVSGGIDGILILWNLESGAMLRRYQGHGDAITDVVFTPDGRSVISSGGRDRTVRIWRLDLTEDALMTWIRQNRFVPELTCEQRVRFRLASPSCPP